MPYRWSKRTSTGHTICLTIRKTNPTCPKHQKRAIIREPPDELGLIRWFCIDCIAEAIYEKKKDVTYKVVAVPKEKK